MNRWKSIFWGGFSFLLFVFGQLYFWGTDVLTKPFWLDELITWIICRNSPAEIISALLAACDTNLPLYYLLVKTVQIWGFNDEVSLRLFNLVCIAGIMGVLTAYSSRDFKHKVAAWAVAMLLWGNLFFIYHAFNARCYALFVLICVSTLMVSGETLRQGKGSWVLAFLVFLCCMTHYFGIIWIGSIFLSQLILSPRKVVRSAYFLRSYIVGVFLAAPLLAFFYWSQSKNLPYDTWISSTQLSDVLKMLRVMTMYSWSIWFVFLVLLFASVLSGSLRSKIREEFVLLLTPLLYSSVLLLFSFTIQPAHLPRYFLPAFLFFPFLVRVFCAARLTLICLAFLPLLFVFSAPQFHAVADKVPFVCPYHTAALPVDDGRSQVIFSDMQSLYRCGKYCVDDVDRYYFDSSVFTPTAFRKIQSGLFANLSAIYDDASTYDASTVDHQRSCFFISRFIRAENFVEWTGHTLMPVSYRLYKVVPPEFVEGEAIDSHTL